MNCDTLRSELYESIHTDVWSSLINVMSMDCPINVYRNIQNLTWKVVSDSCAGLVSDSTVGYNRIKTTEAK